ncbi:MAG: hypothetical protein ACRC0L_00995, partial [Angustibacter sp.]
MMGTNEQSTLPWWQDPARRPLTTVLAIGGFGAVCLLGLTLGLRGLATSPVDPAPGPNRSAPPPAAPAGISGFTTPSGNIRCAIS